MGLGACLLGVAIAPTARSQNFGRWEHALNSCQIQHRVAKQPRSEGSRDCLKLRLEQNIEGLLSARFVAPGAQLMFAGSLAKGQQPMRCDNEGSCNPQWPIQLEVRTVANGKMASSGLPAGLPQAQLALGFCLIDRTRITCVVLAANGEHWLAESEL